jgi:hypothetical protein
MKQGAGLIDFSDENLINLSGNAPPNQGELSSLIL